MVGLCFPGETETPLMFPILLTYDQEKTKHRDDSETEKSAVAYYNNPDLTLFNHEQTGEIL